LTCEVLTIKRWQERFEFIDGTPKEQQNTW